MKKKIAIVGYGYVGKAMYKLFKDHYDVVVYDPYLKDSCSVYPDVNFVNQDITNSCDLAVICVPTPRREDGTCDISIVESVMKWLQVDLILLKSTVEIGTTDCLCEAFEKNIVFSPEYCGESSYWSPYKFDNDIRETPFFIFGGNPVHTSAMVNYFLPITGPTKKYIQCWSEEAEMAKYMENSFYATKIAFCYEMFEICKNANLDWNRVRELWLQDPRINPMHTAVFAENDRPFGGKCLPKDTSALVEFAKKMHYEPELLKEVLKTNDRLAEIRKKRRDNESHT